MAQVLLPKRALVLCLILLTATAGASAWHTSLYVPGWYQTSSPGAKNYFNISGIDLSGVDTVYYSFAWIRNGTSGYEAYDPFSKLG